jgi:hypothetical protein
VNIGIFLKIEDYEGEVILYAGSSFIQVNTVLSFHFDIGNSWTIGARHVKSSQDFLLNKCRCFSKLASLSGILRSAAVICCSKPQVSPAAGVTVGTAPGGTPAPATPLVGTPTTPTTPVLNGVDQVKTEDTKQAPHPHTAADGEFYISRWESNINITLRDLLWRYECHSAGSTSSPCYHNAVH